MSLLGWLNSWLTQLGDIPMSLSSWYNFTDISVGLFYKCQIIGCELIYVYVAVVPDFKNIFYVYTRRVNKTYSLSVPV